MAGSTSISFGSKKKLRALYGKWTECLYSVDPATFDAYKKNDKKNIEEKKNSKQVSASEESDEMPMPDSESVLVIPGSILLWRIAPRPPNSAQVRPPVYLDLMALFPRPGQNQEEGGGERRVIELLLSHPSVVPPPGLGIAASQASWCLAEMPWGGPLGGFLYTY